MTLLDRQLAQAVNDTATTIRLFRQTAKLTRPAVAGEDSFFGSHEPSETQINGNIAIEMKPMSPADLTEIGADAVASVLPGSGVKEQDFLEVGGIRYRITEVKPQNLFGAMTHIDLHLELEKREAAHG